MLLALLLWGAAIWSVRPDWLALLALAAGGAAPRQPGASRRPGRRRAGAARCSARTGPAGCSCSSRCWSSGFPRASARRMLIPTRPAQSPNPWSSAASRPAPTPPTSSMSASASSSVQVRLGELEEREPLRRRGDRPAPLRRPALGERRLVRSVRRSAWRAGRALPGDGARGAGGPYAGLAPADCCSAASARRSTATTAPSPSRPSFEPRALEAERRRSPSPASPIRAARAPSASAIDHRARDLGRVLGRLSHDRLRLLGGVIAGEGRRMQRDHAWHSARHLADLEAPDEIGRRAGERAVARLDRDAARPGRYPVLFDPRVAAIAARPLRRRDQRRVDRPQDQLPSGQARRARCSARRHHRRRSAAAARPALAAVRCRGRARRAARAGRGRHAHRLDRGERLGAPARHRADRPCHARRRRRARRRAEQSLYGARHAQPRGN